jgi:hypothetical protein
MVAGEFAEDDGYIAKYAATIQHSHAFWSGYPHVWSLHDYHDLVNYYAYPHNSYAEAFLRKLGRRLHNPRIWFSEQGVALRNGETTTNLDNGSESQDIKRQVTAAKDFLRLGSIHLAKEQSRVEVVDYYLYKGPSAAKLVKEPNAFDSALLPGEGVTEEEKHPADNPRPAYCVLALGLEGCPAGSKTQSVVTSSMTSESGMISAIIIPNGLPTKYVFEYGTTEAYGKTTAVTALPNEDGEQSETVTLSGLEPCTTYHYQAEAENEANEGTPGLGGDETFETPCLPTAITEITVGPDKIEGYYYATYTGKVNPNSEPTVYYWQVKCSIWWTEKCETKDEETVVSFDPAHAEYGGKITGDGFTSVSNTVTDESCYPYRPYYEIRLIAKNPSGISYGDYKTVMMGECIYF